MPCSWPAWCGVVLVCRDGSFGREGDGLRLDGGRVELRGKAGRLFDLFTDVWLRTIPRPRTRSLDLRRNRPDFSIKKADNEIH